MKKPCTPLPTDHFEENNEIQEMLSQVNEEQSPGPSEMTIRNILNYSRALEIVNTQTSSMDIVLN